MHEILVFTSPRTQHIHHRFIVTMSAYSQPFPFRPPNHTAIIIGTSSFTAMHFSLDTLSHSSWNQFCPDQAPQPQTPDASEVSKISARSVLTIMLVLFQPSANVFHQAISDLNASLQLKVPKSLFAKMVCQDVSLCKRVARYRSSVGFPLPHQYEQPIQLFLWKTKFSQCCIDHYPPKRYAGPSFFSGAEGTPKYAHTHSKIFKTHWQMS